MRPVLRAICALSILSAHSSQAAVLSVCADHCQFAATAAGLQSAFDAANCGDAIQIQAGAVITGAFAINKSCPTGQEIVVTTSMPDWLPDPDMRITPAYLPVVPVLRWANLGNTPLLSITATNPAPSGIKFIGVAFLHEGPLAPYTLLSVGTDYPAALADLPDNITFDRVYISADSNPAVNFADGIRLATKSASILNSFFDQGHGKLETHWMLSHNSIGPHIIRNTYFGGGMAAAIFYGGNGGPTFTEGHPIASNIQIESNYFYKSLRWFPGNSLYVGDTNFPCMKNMVEFKAGTNAVIRWNTGENSWGGCQGQQNAFTFTPRVNLQCHGNQSCDLSGGAAALSGDNRVVTISNFQGLPILAGEGLALPTKPNPSFGNWETRTVVAADPSNHVYTVDAPYTRVYASFGMTYAQVFGPWNVVSDMQVYGNYLKNVELGFMISGLDDFAVLGAANNLAIRNNVFANLSPHMKIALAPISHNNLSLRLGLVEYAASNIQIDNNTYFTSPVADASVQQNNTILLLTADLGLVHSLSFRNNLAPYGDYGIFGNGSGSGSRGVNAATDGTSVILNNTLLGNVAADIYEPCTAPRSCRSNFFGTPAQFLSQFRNPAANDYSLADSSPYRHAGYDGSSLGADMNQVAAIGSLSVQPAPYSLTFQWSLTPILANMGCTLEISADSSLVTDVVSVNRSRPGLPASSGHALRQNPYVLVNALRPDYFKRAVSDRSNPGASMSIDGLTRSFTVGSRGSVTGDDGVPHDLALNPETTYYYRLMCGGATERGSVKTLADPQ